MKLLRLEPLNRDNIGRDFGFLECELSSWSYVVASWPCVGTVMPVVGYIAQNSSDMRTCLCDWGEVKRVVYIELFRSCSPQGRSLCYDESPHKMLEKSCIALVMLSSDHLCYLTRNTAWQGSMKSRKSLIRQRKRVYCMEFVDNTSGNVVHFRSLILKICSP